MKTVLHAVGTRDEVLSLPNGHYVRITLTDYEFRALTSVEQVAPFLGRVNSTGYEDDAGLCLPPETLVLVSVRPDLSSTVGRMVYRPNGWNHYYRYHACPADGRESGYERIVVPGGGNVYSDDSIDVNGVLMGAFDGIIGVESPLSWKQAYVKPVDGGD